MYLPQRFHQDDREAALNLARQYPLATLISTDQERPFVSHLPLVFEESEQSLDLIGHLARGNPQWKLMNGKSVYVIFHGPNAYISPSWYEHHDVPTWNYAVGHMEGICTLIEDREQIVGCLKKLSAFAESKFQSPWEFSIPEDLAAEGVIEKSIVGFKIEVTSIKSKYKLIQNRSEADLRGAIDGLAVVDTGNSREISDLMRSSWYAYNQGDKK